jgi:hypothetical protein
MSTKDETARWATAARALFSMLSSHSYDEVLSYGQFWSDRMMMALMVEEFKKGSTP